MTERLITRYLSKGSVLEVGVDLLREDFLLAVITVLESIAVLLLILVEVVLVVLIVSRLAKVLGEENGTAYLLNSSDHGLSTHLTSAQVSSIASMSVPGVTSC